MNFLDQIWLIPLFPLGGAMLMLLLGRLLDPQPASEVAIAPGVEPEGHHAGHADASGHGHHAHSPLKFLVSLICPGTVLLSFLLSAARGMAAFEPAAAGCTKSSSSPGSPACPSTWPTATWRSFTWIGVSCSIPLSSVMILVVTGIGFLIHVYSIGYMAHDNGYYRFFGYMNLFVFFMLMLVLANNYTLLFVGWEGVGLCSYLLIGFYFHKKSAADAGKKAFVVNRVGDAGFILGMLLMFSVLGTVRFTEVNALLRGGHFIAGNRRLRRAQRDGACDVFRRHRQVGADSLVHLAAGRDGRPDPGFRADPRGHHGHRGRLYGRALVGFVRADAAYFA